MKNFSNLAMFFVILLTSLIIIGCTSYNIGIGPTSKDNILKKVEIKEGSTYLTISKILKDNKLIKSETFYKLYIKLFKPTSLETCTYNFSENMGVKKIVKILEEGCKINPDAVMLTIPEGKNIEQIADIVASITNNTKKELLNTWNSKAFIDEVISKYEFVTAEVKSSKIKYALEGYLFPSTYELKDKNVDPKYIAYKMLDELKRIYEKNKETIKQSDYTFHEILTMASIVEYEAILDKDRGIIAGIFYNRLENISYETVGKLQSCATLGYAIGEWKLTYSPTDLEVVSPYNTYLYKGLPIGPGGMPGEASINAAINPTKTDYYYFMANVYDKKSVETYYAKTYTGHQQNCIKYLGKSC